MPSSKVPPVGLGQTSNALLRLIGSRAVAQSSTAANITVLLPLLGMETTWFTASKSRSAGLLRPVLTNVTGDAVKVFSKALTRAGDQLETRMRPKQSKATPSMLERLVVKVLNSAPVSRS